MSADRKIIVENRESGAQVWMNCQRRPTYGARSARGVCVNGLGSRDEARANIETEKVKNLSEGERINLHAENLVKAGLAKDLATECALVRFRNN